MRGLSDDVFHHRQETVRNKKRPKILKIFLIGTKREATNPVQNSKQRHCLVPFFPIKGSKFRRSRNNILRKRVILLEAVLQG